MKKFLLFVLFLGIFVSFFPTSINAKQVIDKIAPNKEFYQGIDKFIKAEMKKSNADPEKGKYNFVVALSTSHFSSDQRNVVAMKQASYLIANNLCTVGDSLTSVSWELDVWDISDTFKLSEDGAERRQFVNSLPKTPMDQSKGGHDTYKALMTILKKIEKPESTIVILITNSHESRGPMGEHYSVIGKNSTELKSLLEEKDFRTPEDNSFSLFFEGTDKPTEIFITLALPKNLKSLNDSEANRYPTFPYSTWIPDEYKPSLDVLPEPVKPEPIKEKKDVKQKTETPNTSDTPSPSETKTTTEKNKTGFPIVPIAIGALILIGGIIFAVIPKNNKGNTKKGKTHKITFTFAENDYSADIEEGKTNELLFFDDSFVMVVKGEENPEIPIPEDAKSVFEISYSVGDDSFIFQFNEASMVTEPSELTDIQDMGGKRYMIKNGVSAYCALEFDKNEYNLQV